MNKCEKVDNSCREEKMGCENCAYNKQGTIIKSKYKLKQKVWVVDANNDNYKIDIYTDVIIGIFVDSQGVWYLLEGLNDDIKEEKLIPYEDTETLLKEIIKADNEINK